MDAITQLPNGIDISSGDVEVSLMDVGRSGDRIYFSGMDFNADKPIVFITEDPDFSQLGNRELKDWVRNPENIATVKDQVVAALGEKNTPADQKQHPSVAVVEMQGEEWGLSDAVIAAVDPQANIVSAPESEPLHIDNPDDLLTTDVELGTLGR